MKQTFAHTNGSPFRNNLVSLNNINPFLALMSQALTIESKEKKEFIEGRDSKAMYDIYHKQRKHTWASSTHNIRHTQAVLKRPRISFKCFL